MSIMRALEVFDLKNEVTTLKEYLLADSLKHEELVFIHHYEE